MFKQKGFLGLVLIVALVLAMSIPAQAASTRFSLRSSGAITESTASVLGAATWVYGIQIYASAANVGCALLDRATLTTSASGITASEVKVEIGEATQYEVSTLMFDTPIYFANGVTAQMSGGVAIVYYGPKP